MPSTPWDTYAKELLPRGYGYALWNPEPDSAGEVEIGDVGYTEGGQFHRLFNAMHHAGHHFNIRGVPEGFEQLIIHNGDIHSSNLRFSAPYIFSKEVENVDIGTKVNVGSSMHLRFRFKSKRMQGAVLVLPTKSARKVEITIHTKKVKEYIRQHYVSWMNFAEKLNLNFTADELVFVKGWIKTEQWAVAASTETEEEKKVAVGFGKDRVANAAFSIVMTRSKTAEWEHQGATLPILQSFHKREPSAKQDQCIFIQKVQCSDILSKWAQRNLKKKRIRSQRPQDQPEVSAPVVQQRGDKSSELLRRHARDTGVQLSEESRSIITRLSYQVVGDLTKVLGEKTASLPATFAQETQTLLERSVSQAIQDYCARICEDYKAHGSKTSPEGAHALGTLNTATLITATRSETSPRSELVRVKTRPLVGPRRIGSHNRDQESSPSSPHVGYRGAPAHMGLQTYLVVLSSVLCVIIIEICVRTLLMPKLMNRT
ncbi:hypothetical protein DAEQUDRAFT_814340 [Daedalea quercina L-15889]|uniref:Uncharacterized protein n=1 Tax=Daedalea quercina L-15889 TaxID=1314783 RepID=A0A165M8J3_9APHY|nr:hypothetical protein DAEQUDRAFT_814340 [Daedalea quercina L-15889]